MNEKKFGVICTVNDTGMENIEKYEVILVSNIVKYLVTLLQNLEVKICILFFTENQIRSTIFKNFVHLDAVNSRIEVALEESHRAGERVPVYVHCKGTYTQIVPFLNENCEVKVRWKCRIL